MPEANDIVYIDDISSFVTGSTGAGMATCGTYRPGEGYPKQPFLQISDIDDYSTVFPGLSSSSWGRSLGAVVYDSENSIIVAAGMSTGSPSTNRIDRIVICGYNRFIGAVENSFSLGSCFLSENEVEAYRPPLVDLGGGFYLYLTSIQGPVDISGYSWHGVIATLWKYSNNGGVASINCVSSDICRIQNIAGYSKFSDFIPFSIGLTESFGSSGGDAVVLINSRYTDAREEIDQSRLVVGTVNVVMGSSPTVDIADGVNDFQTIRILPEQEFQSGCAYQAMLGNEFVFTDCSSSEAFSGTGVGVFYKSLTCHDYKKIWLFQISPSNAEASIVPMTEREDQTYPASEVSFHLTSNPVVDGVVEIATNGTISTGTEALLFDVSGRMIGRTSPDVSGTFRIASVHGCPLPTGVYTAVVTQNGEACFVSTCAVID